MKRILLALAAVVAVLAPAAPAWAHAQLLSAVPARDQTLTTAPTAVTLTFSEKLNPEFVTVVLSDAGRQRLPLSAPAVDGSEATATLTQPIGNGTYTVAYRVVSRDGHTVQGSYGFTVGDPAQRAAPSAAAAPPAGSGGLPTGVVIGLAALGVILAALAVWFWFAGRRQSDR
ncbi:copper resistance CopC family protein [Paractinoplanes bogorensis]|uniref:copper resistance CopC family protein n=1 Tax=Paractinoplanes bogorensis TaxID=1610840 RepID=UPI0027E1AE95|nr:copper resistance protein CopC [Actinoplanes bogorensis]